MPNKLSGYGHSTPSTVAGRTFCMVYALIGIPLGLVMFQSIGERLNTFVGFSLSYAKRVVKTKNPEVTQTNLVMVVSVLSTILMTSMAAVFAKYERWEYFDAFYYCFITLTTIGFGDYVALQKESALQSKPEYVALSLIFILFGLSVVSSAVNLLVLKFLTLNTEDERRDERLRYTAAQNPIQLEGDVITSAAGKLLYARDTIKEPTGNQADELDFSPHHRRQQQLASATLRQRKRCHAHKARHRWPQSAADVGETAAFLARAEPPTSLDGTLPARSPALVYGPPHAHSSLSSASTGTTEHQHLDGLETPGSLSCGSDLLECDDSSGRARAQLQQQQHLHLPQPQRPIVSQLGGSSESLAGLASGEPDCPGGVRSRRSLKHNWRPCPCHAYAAPVHGHDHSHGLEGRRAKLVAHSRHCRRHRRGHFHLPPLQAQLADQQQQQHKHRCQHHPHQDHNLGQPEHQTAQLIQAYPANPTLQCPSCQANDKADAERSQAPQQVPERENDLEIFRNPYHRVNYQQLDYLNQSQSQHKQHKRRKKDLPGHHLMLQSGTPTTTTTDSASNWPLAPFESMPSVDRCSPQRQRCQQPAKRQAHTSCSCSWITISSPTGLADYYATPGLRVARDATNIASCLQLDATSLPRIQPHFFSPQQLSDPNRSAFIFPPATSSQLAAKQAQQHQSQGPSPEVKQQAALEYRIVACGEHNDDGDDDEDDDDEDEDEEASAGGENEGDTQLAGRERSADRGGQRVVRTASKNDDRQPGDSTRTITKLVCKCCCQHAECIMHALESSSTPGAPLKQQQRDKPADDNNNNTDSRSRQTTTSSGHPEANPITQVD